MSACVQIYANICTKQRLTAEQNRTISFTVFTSHQIPVMKCAQSAGSSHTYQGQFLNATPHERCCKLCHSNSAKNQQSMALVCYQTYHILWRSPHVSFFCQHNWRKCVRMQLLSEQCRQSRPLYQRVFIHLKEMHSRTAIKTCMSIHRGVHNRADGKCF